MRFHLTRRGRVVLTSMAAIPLIAAAAVFAVNGAGAVASESPSTTQFDYVTIQPGGSLWQVATRVAENADPRDVISDIMTLNQLQSVAVTPGQRIAIPAKY